MISKTKAIYFTQKILVRMQITLPSLLANSMYECDIFKGWESLTFIAFGNYLFVMRNLVCLICLIYNNLGGNSR